MFYYRYPVLTQHTPIVDMGRHTFVIIATMRVNPTKVVRGGKNTGVHTTVLFGTWSRQHHAAPK